MSKNTRWSIEDFKQKGLIQVDGGDYVKASTQVATGKVEKIVPGFAYQDEYGRINSPLSTKTSAKEMPVTTSIKQQDFWQFHTGEQLIIKTIFDLDPLPAPRMSQSDKWKTDPNHIDPLKRQRPPVKRYFAFKNKLQALCAENGYNLTPVLNILFVVPMPPSWSKKKQEAMLGQPHQQRPDRDNYLKAFQDSFKCDDGFVWDGRTIKVWGEKGQIIIF